ncbi:ATP-dependent Clp protease proteolytic subunit OS=Streptomyces cyaneofuscatus OX=66883 GN=clpP PE=3 SV=1 [Streptomyces cyaneofuscatus]
MVNTHMNNFPGASASGLYTGPQVDNRYVVPRFVERTSQGVREYDPYAKLFEERVIFLGVQIDDASANDVMAQLLCLESMDPDRDISIYINSPGGSFTALTAIYDTMQFVKPDIQTVCMGQAASAAAVLLAAGTPGKRMALPHARVLIHQPSSQTGREQLSDLEIAANEILRMRTQLEQMLARHSTTPLEKISEDIERDKILTAEDALAYGLVDQIVSTRKTTAPASALTRRSLPCRHRPWHGLGRVRRTVQGGPERGPAGNSASAFDFPVSGPDRSGLAGSFA